MKIKVYIEYTGTEEDKFLNMNSVADYVEDCIVQFCRDAFRKKKLYKNMWILPIYYDDKYERFTDVFFSEVGIELYPKITDLNKELKRRGITPPKMSKNATREDKIKYKEEWDKYRAIVWDIVHKDIAENRRSKVKPVSVVVKGVRILTEKIDSNGHNIVTEKIVGINKVKNFDYRNNDKAQKSVAKEKSVKH